MSDNPLHTTPTPPRNAADTVLSPKNSPASDTHIKVLKLPDDLKQSSQTTRKIEGRVTHTDPRTSRVTIKTAQGDVELQLPKEAKLPPRGTTVEVKITPQPPRQGSTTPSQTATLSPLPAPPLKNDQLQLNTPARTPSATSYQPPNVLTPQNLQTLPPLQMAQAVRIAPLPASQIQSIQIAPLTALNTSLPPTLSGTSIAQLTTPAAPLSTINAANTSTLFSFFLPAPSTSPANLTTTIPPLQSALISSHPPPVSSIIISSHNQASPDLLAKITILPKPQTITPLTFQDASSSIIQPKGTALTLQMVQTQTALQQTIFSQNFTPAHLPATVIGHLPQGQPVLSLTSFSAINTNTFFILQNAALPIGATLSLPLTELQTLQAAQLNAKNNSLPLSNDRIFKADTWPALAELLDTLSQNAPQLAQNLAQILPSVKSPAQIPTALLLFIAAVRGGDLAAWTGDKPLDTLRNLGKSELINRLGNDFSTLSRTALDPLPNDWRGLVFPFHSEAELHNIALYYKHEQEENADNDTKKQTRFLFDMSLSRMGMVQLDGLFKPYENHKRLDIIIRTESPLSETMKQTMRQNYTQVLGSAELNGDLSFQSEIENFVEIHTKNESGENIEFVT